MSHSEHTEEEELTRQEAAERLTDIAYTLTSGCPLKLGHDEEVTVPERVTLKRQGKSRADRVELELELSWSTASASPPTPPEAVRGG